MWLPKDKSSILQPRPDTLVIIFLFPKLKKDSWNAIFWRWKAQGGHKQSREGLIFFLEGVEMMISFCKKSIEFTVNYIGKYTYFIFLCLLVHILTQCNRNSQRNQIIGSCLGFLTSHYYLGTEYFNKNSFLKIFLNFVLTSVMGSLSTLPLVSAI